ncbi:pantoate--beta-alanine ligase [Cryobacterium algoritolerans]|uniref:Pantothenate synthetase n=1 Tax=Cryobacterium algoritolerans TaxID=1259184 RepID=A0A4R8WLA8_9MICO|nr:pantoate--beta-alanine ligase [Cryobacterium algoritolerans]TFC12010.1 pantoate--beta-alanine ligase [Cryobacterium algoritolerans]
MLTTPEVIDTIGGLRARLAEAGERHAGGSPCVVLVPTMGALHAGHLALVRRARELGDTVVVSIFVNPLQFGAGEDLASYPRTLGADVVALATVGVDVVFAPTSRIMYPHGPSSTRVTAGNVGTLYEGAARPGHFDGMLTVVGKLINIVDPDVIVFGQKDAQQVFLVETMLADLDFRPVIEVVPIVREEGGLALSSRNRNLVEEQHAAAGALSAGLAAAASVAGRGVAAAQQAAHALIDAQPLVKLDYLVVVDPQTFLPVATDHHGPARMLVAALVGSTRLIDNAALDLN